MAISKVVFGSETLIDLTADTVTADKLAQGITAHGKDGEPITGTNTFDSDTSDATAAIAEILNGKTAYARGSKITGIMPNNESFTSNITTKEQRVSIPQGYHDGSGSVGIDATEQAKLIAGNIKTGVTVLGVVGTLEPSSEVTAQDKTVTPTREPQVILPDEGIDYLSQVTVSAIPYVESDNSAGGQTATIAG